MWAREWSTLSGGEGQRVALAIAIGLGGAVVVLLDGELFHISQSWMRKGRIGEVGWDSLSFWLGTAWI